MWHKRISSSSEYRCTRHWDDVHWTSAATENEFTNVYWRRCFVRYNRKQPDTAYITPNTVDPWRTAPKWSGGTLMSMSPKVLLLWIYAWHCDIVIDFLPRDVIRKRGLCCRPVSVRLSVCHVGILYPEDIIKLLSQPGSPIILFFWPPAPVSNSKRNPFSFCEKFAIFVWNHRLSRKPYEIGPLLLWNVNRS